MSGRLFLNMSLRVAAEKVDSRQPAPKCHVAILRLQLDDLDRKFLDDMLKADPLKVTSVYIEDVLKADDHPVSEFSIRRHRNGRCRCAE